MPRSHHTHMRRRNGTLELPVHSWSRPADGARVVNIGMIHFAESAFYDAVREQIAAIPNARVLYEGIQRSSDEALEKLTCCERTAILAQRKRADQQARFMHSTGLHSQRAALDPRVEGWHASADITDVELVRTLDLVRNPDVLGEDMSDLLDLPDMAYRVVGRAMRFILCRTPLTEWGRLKKSVRVVIEDRRNAVAVAAALATADERDVIAVLPWGAKHLPGIGDALSANGFVLSDVGWLQAVHARRRL